MWEEILEVWEPEGLRAVKTEVLKLGRGPGVAEEEAGARLFDGREACTGTDIPDANAEGEGVGNAEAAEGKGAG